MIYLIWFNTYYHKYWMTNVFHTYQCISTQFKITFVNFGTWEANRAFFGTFLGPIEGKHCIWGSGLFFVLALIPGGIGAPQIGGFCGSVAFWGVFASKRGIQAILPLWAPRKAIYHQYRVFYPCGLPKKPFGPLTGYFNPVCSSKSHLAPNTMVFTTVSTVFPQTDWEKKIIFFTQCSKLDRTYCFFHYLNMQVAVTWNDANSNYIIKGLSGM